MIRINLLPFRAARKKENIRRQVSIFLLSLVFLLIILFYYNSSLSSQIDGLKSVLDHDPVSDVAPHAHGAEQ